MRRSILLAATTLLLAAPAWAQVDIAGEWGRDNHEDQPHRAPGAELGDYTGHPINAAARQKAESWDASILSQPEQQAKPHPAQLDAGAAAEPADLQGDRSDWRQGRRLRPGGLLRPCRPDDLDGRPAASVAVRRAHLGRVLHRRMGGRRHAAEGHHHAHEDVIHQPQRHPEQLPWCDDRVLLRARQHDGAPVDRGRSGVLEEPMVRSNNFSRALGQHVGPAIPFETVDELGDRPIGWVPHWPVGTRTPSSPTGSGCRGRPRVAGRKRCIPNTRRRSRQLKKKAPNRTASTRPADASAPR